MATLQSHDARLNFRLSRSVKERIEWAALVSGQSVSDFAASALADQDRNKALQGRESANGSCSTPRPAFWNCPRVSACPP
jgi:hypothetical protein